MVFVADTFRNNALQTARLRILLRQHTPGALRKPVTPRLREAALALCAFCETSQRARRDNTSAMLADLTGTLVDRMQRIQEGKPDALATAWGVLALRMAAELDVRPAVAVEWNALKAKDPENAEEIITALLHRRALTDDEEDDGTLALSRLLVEDLRAHPKRKRSLDEWYLGAVALKDFEGWRAWKAAMTAAVLRAQARDGSWGAGVKGGPRRVRSTALAVLCFRIAIYP